MDLYDIALQMWPCIQEHLPSMGDAAGAILQIVGGATILYRLIASQKAGVTESTPVLGKALSFLGKLAMNKPVAPTQ